jgi:uncharacterized surface protein with fasciclin (FAS1) repeats
MKDKIIKKDITMKNLALRLLILSSKLFITSFLIVGCTEEPELWKVKESDQVISQYVESIPDFSDFQELLVSTGLKSLMAIRGPFTLFIPSNAAMSEYYALKNVSSHTGFSQEFKRELVLNHLIPFRIETGDIGLGAIREVNGIGDYLVTEFDGADIIINKTSKIIKRNINVSNGVVHHIDKVIDPISKSVYEILESNPSFSLFTEGLKRTNLKDTLQLINFPFGTRTARTRFTILAVADTTFNRFGINNIDQLIAYFTDSPQTITQLNNGFYRYMEYHCLAETYYLNNFNTRLYPILSYDNNISMTVTDDYKINLVPATQQYTGFLVDHSNYPAKNGAIHTVTDLLPVFQPRPTVFEWETTDHFDIKQGDYFGKYYMRWHDGQNTFKNIKWEADYLLYYYKIAHSLINDDALSASGWFWVEVTTPKIMKGKYRLSGDIWNNQFDYAVYIDGVNTANIKRSDPAKTTSWGEFDWTETREHTVRIVATSPGLLFWDTVIFTPIQ